MKSLSGATPSWLPCQTDISGLEHPVSVCKERVEDHYNTEQTGALTTALLRDKDTAEKKVIRTHPA